MLSILPLKKYLFFKHFFQYNYCVKCLYCRIDIHQFLSAVVQMNDDNQIQFGNCATVTGFLAALFVGYSTPPGN